MRFSFLDDTTPHSSHWTVEDANEWLARHPNDPWMPEELRPKYEVHVPKPYTESEQDKEV